MSSVHAWDNECRFNCHWQTPRPTKSPTPTASPEPTKSPEPKCEEDCETPMATPSATPEATPTPEPHHDDFTLGGPAYAPTQPLCPTIEGWLPQITYNGFTNNHNGTWTFNYTIKSVSESNPVWWVWYGPTPTSLPQVKIVYGEKAEITQEWSTNWITAALYREPGCFGKWSAVVN